MKNTDTDILGNPSRIVNKTLEAFQVTLTCPHTGHLYRPTLHLTIVTELRLSGEWFVFQITDAGRLVFSFDESVGLNSPLVRAICEEQGWSQCSRMGSIWIEGDEDEDCDEDCDEDELFDEFDDELDEDCDEDE